MSYVGRWSCIFCDNICEDVDIELVPGKHLPVKADVAMGKVLKRELDETKLSMAQKEEEDEEEFNLSRRTPNTSINNSFNSSSIAAGRVGSGSSRSANPCKHSKQDDYNPWSIRDSHTPRHPKDSTLTFEYNK